MKEKLLIFVFTLVFIPLFGQTFRGSVILGFNASQIDGDYSAGFHKIGLQAGVGGGFQFSQKWGFNLEMLFNQKGSQNKLIKGSPDLFFRISSNYFDLPVYVSYSDWYSPDEDRFKIKFIGGLSYGRLFSFSTTVQEWQYLTDVVNKNDISYMLGAIYYWSQRWSSTFRFTRSITKLYSNKSNPLPFPNINSLGEYMLGFNIGYNF